MKMARRLRCSSVTYPLRYAPSTASPARTALPAAHFDRNETYAYVGGRAVRCTQGGKSCYTSPFFLANHGLEQHSPSRNALRLGIHFDPASVCMSSARV